MLNSKENQIDKTVGSEHRQKLIHAGKLHAIHWLVIVLSLLLTTGAWYFSKEQLHEKIQGQFEREADQTIELVKERMELYENALWGGVSMIDMNKGEINDKQWLAYANSLQIVKTYPGINGIGVIFNVQKEQMPAYMAKETSSRPGYKLHPEHNEAEYWPITYIEPASTNTKAIGLDMAFETNRYSSIKKARDSGEAQMTGPITLVQDDKKTPGFLFYAPFYKNGQKPQDIDARRNTIVGVTYAPFIMEKLMQGTLAQQNRHVSVKISDENTLLYEDGSNLKHKPMFSKSVPVPLYGRNWSFEIWSNVDFNKASANTQPYIILFGGIVIDALLLALFLFLTRANRLALFYADEMTRELKDKTVDLQRSNHDLEQFSYVASHDLKSPLRGISQLVTWIGEDIDDKEATDEHLELMASRILRMENLLDDLLAYARVGRGDEQFRKIDSKQQLLFLYDMVSAPSKFELQLKGEFPTFNTLNAPFEQVFRNLFSNAIKHHDKSSGIITVTVTDADPHYCFKVSDDGPGIDGAYHDKIFDLFQTLKPRDEVEGSGMGLAIIKKIMSHHGGRIEVQSEDGKGACFSVYWPKIIIQVNEEK